MTGPAGFNDRWLGLDAYNNELRKLVATARCWAVNCFRNESGELGHLLVICGANGVGKTRVLRGVHRFMRAAAMAAWPQFWKKGPPQVRYADWNRWANLDVADEGDCLAFDDLCEPDVLFLDDVGAEADRYRSGLALANLTSLLSRREHRWTALTMNYLPESWVGTDTAPGRFGRRIGDRLLRDSTIVALRSTLSWAVAHQKV